MARRRTVATALRAIREFEDARRWLTQAGSGAAGARRWATLAGIRRSLAEHPNIGTPTGQAGLRQLSVSGYRVVYQAPSDLDGTDPVLIIAVLAPGQP